MISKKVRIHVCRFCMNNDSDFDYKNEKKWRRFITDRGKIIPRRLSGNCAKHQRKTTKAVKRARYMALLPYTTDSFK